MFTPPFLLEVISVFNLLLVAQTFMHRYGTVTW